MRYIIDEGSAAEPATYLVESTMRGIIYLVGLVVVIGVIIAFVF